MIDRSDRGFLDDLGCIVIEADPETLQVVDANAVVVERLLGYEPGHWHRQGFFTSEFVHGDDLEFVVAKLARLYDQSPVEIQFRAFCADREEIRLRGLFALNRKSSDDRDKVRGILSIHRDVSESQNLTEERLQLALDAAKMGVWDWNVRDSTIFWSDQVYRLHGIQREEFESPFDNYLLLVERVHPNDVEAIEEIIRNALSTGEDYEIEYRFWLPKGAYVWLEVKGRIYSNAEGRPVRIAGTVQDVTARKTAELSAQVELVERRRAERELRKLTENLELRVDERTSELQKANAMLKGEILERTRTERELAQVNNKLKRSNRELQEFAYVASHDLKEPLRKISTFADLLRYDCGDQLSDDAGFYIERMQDSASRMTALIDDLLQFSRIKTAGQTFQRVDLNEIVEFVRNDIEIRIQEVEGQLSVEKLPSIDADPTQMRQLFQNLISNALKFRREDARPEVLVYEEKTEGRGSGASWLCRLIVEDNGIGIDDRYAERIFAPFQRLHMQYEGTGMGLAICRRIVERHQGTIDVTSTPGRGSRFILDLPIHQSAANE